MSHFDERSGQVECETPWGTWSQTVDEVVVEVNVDEGTRSKDVRCTIGPRSLALNVAGKEIFQGQLFKVILTSESVWTLEDRKLVRIVLVKSDRDASNCWESLLIDQYQCGPLVKDEMEKKLTLERFQKENPGYDFSGAEVTGNYRGGGPRFS